ncbi:hypothetical protein ABUR78_15850, partial [Staphylococcus aureus]|nr:hypothetical protein [Staphylococcus aureus]
RYLVAIIACMIWYLNKAHVSIIGIIIGLMISYVVVIKKWIKHLIQMMVQLCKIMRIKRLMIIMM